MGTDRHQETANVARVADVIRDVGFCVVPSLISEELCAELRVVLMRLLRAEKEQNRHPSGHQRTMHLLMKHPVFTKLLCNPFVLAVWRRYLGNDIICSTMSGNALWPGSTELYWHVDHPYWTIPEPYPTDPPLSGQTIWMIDDFTWANGATAGIEGSHRRPTLPRLGDHWTEEATVLIGHRGSAIFADGAWWHTSRPNVSRRTRCAVLNTYIRSYCVTQEDMRMQLEAIKRPTKQVKQLLGANQYTPRRELPY
jgi:ectoine hydroxylase-related dioxygenase (phytanoyl-CoA dioxygenase family)